MILSRNRELSQGPGIGDNKGELLRNVQIE